MLFANAIDVVNTLSAAQLKSTLKAELRRYTTLALLVLDQVGYLPINQPGADLLFQITIFAFSQFKFDFEIHLVLEVSDIALNGSAGCRQSAQVKNLQPRGVIPHEADKPFEVYGLVVAVIFPKRIVKNSHCIRVTGQFQTS